MTENREADNCFQSNTDKHGLRSSLIRVVLKTFFYVVDSSMWPGIRWWRTGGRKISKSLSCLGPVLPVPANGDEGNSVCGYGVGLGV